MGSKHEELSKTIEAVSALGSQPSVATRLIELGKSPDAELDDYVDLITVCPALSSKLIAFANSSWFSPRFPITVVKRAVGMIGINQVRALSISYCLESMHNQIQLEHAEARAFWEASLFKAVAARRLVADEKRCDEAFAISLLADMGVGIMAAADRSYIEFLQEGHDLKTTLEFETSLFETTHDQVGEQLCDVFKLPAIYKQAIAGHHQFGETDLPEDDVVAAVRVVANLPHDIRTWVAEDLEIFDVMASTRFGSQCKSAEQLVQDVHDEFSKTVRQFSGSVKQPCNVKKLLEEAMRENALEVTRMAGQLQLLSTNNGKLTEMVNDLADKNVQAQGAAESDPLTGLLNRAGFTRVIESTLAAAALAGESVAMMFIDCNDFKSINDTHGHQAGDTVLTAIAGRLGNKIRKDTDVMARWGGDEMAVLLFGVDEQRAIAFAERMVACINKGPIRWEKGTLDVTISAGLYWVEKPTAKLKVDDLIKEADKRMYQAKSDRCGLVSVPVNDRRVA